MCVKHFLCETCLTLQTHVWCLLHFISILCKHWLLWPKTKVHFLSRERHLGIFLPISHSMILIWLQVISAAPVLIRSYWGKACLLIARKQFGFGVRTKHTILQAVFFSGMHLTVGMEKLCSHPITSWTLFCSLCPCAFPVTSWCSHGLEGATDLFLRFLLYVPPAGCNHLVWKTPSRPLSPSTNMVVSPPHDKSTRWQVHHKKLGVEEGENSACI